MRVQRYPSLRISLYPADDGSAHADAHLASLQEGESQGIENFPDNVLSYVTAPQWTITRRITRKMVRWELHDNEPEIISYCEPASTDMFNTRSDAQLETYLDFTTEQVARLHRRIDAILVVPATAQSAETLLVDYAGEQEEIE